MEQIAYADALRVYVALLQISAGATENADRILALGQLRSRAYAELRAVADSYKNAARAVRTELLKQTIAEAHAAALALGYDKLPVLY